METAFAEAMTRDPPRFLAAVPDDVDVGDLHVVAPALAARADLIVTKNVRHFAPEPLTESGLLVQTADAFLIPQWWFDPEGVGEFMAAMTGRE
jgi:hypothetical protein